MTFTGPWFFAPITFQWILPCHWNMEATNKNYSFPWAIFVIIRRKSLIQYRHKHCGRLKKTANGKTWAVIWNLSLKCRQKLYKDVPHATQRGFDAKLKRSYDIVIRKCPPQIRHLYSSVHRWGFLLFLSLCNAAERRWNKPEKQQPLTEHITWAITIRSFEGEWRHRESNRNFRTLTSTVLQRKAVKSPCFYTETRQRRYQ